MFAALLTGVMKKIFEGNDAISSTMLKEQVFLDSSETVEEIGAMMNSCADILNKAAFENSELPKFEGLLSESGSFSSIQTDVFTKFWGLNRLKVHDAICKDLTWSDSLEKFAWRIDVKTKSRTVAEMNDPVAIVELKVKGDDKERDTRSVRFEMDNAQLEEVLSKLSVIEGVIQKHMG